MEKLWNSEAILLNKVPFCWNNWNNGGILMINDLIHKELPRFLSHEEINETYVNSSFIQILKIRSAIPCKSKRLLVNPKISQPSQPLGFQMVQSLKSPIRLILRRKPLPYHEVTFSASTPDYCPLLFILMVKPKKQYSFTDAVHVTANRVRVDVGQA